MAGPGMGRGIPRAGVLRRESHGSRKLEKNSVGARGEGGVTIGSLVVKGILSTVSQYNADKSPGAPTPA